MKVKCRCGMVYQVTPAIAGKKVRCKKCAATFQAPLMPGVTPQGSLKPRKSVAERRAETGETQRRPAKQSRSVARPKTRQQLKAEHEEKILNKFIDPTRKTLEEQIVERRQDRIEKLRVTNSARYIVFGIILSAAAIGAFALFSYLGNNGGYVPRIIAALYYSGAQWWLPGLLLIASLYHFFIGIGSIMRIVDIDDEEAFPEHFG